MSTASTDPENPTIQAFGCYLAFRHLDRAADRGVVAPERSEAASAVLSGRVTRVWKTLFPGKEAGAYGWILQRFSFLVSSGVIPPAAQDRVHVALQQRAAAASGQEDWGALASLWRVHLLYQFLLEQAASGVVAPEALSRVREGLHSQALSALNVAVKAQVPQAQGFLAAVQQVAAAEITRLSEAGALAASEATALQEALGRPAAIPGAVTFTGGGNCAVCAQGIETAAVVYCAACETPQHAECWSYVGRCSMFACGCVDALPRPGAPRPPPRFDLDSPARVPPPRSPVRTPVGENFAFWALLILLGLCALVTR